MPALQTSRRWVFPAPPDPSAVQRLSQELRLPPTLCRLLVHRGFGEPPAAREFLRPHAGQIHPPEWMAGMGDAVSRLRAAIDARETILVHGDYDVDGICATALAVLTLQELGAEVGWHLPSRFAEGYGLSGATVADLAEEGYGLLLTVDCGITAVAEVAQARALGLDVVVTDHHRPGDELPGCPVVATRPSEYPFPELCGTGVVWKLAEALGVDVSGHLDLVALATVADVVPLVDENRALAIAGLRALARTRKPGLQALMRSAAVDPASVDAGAVGFRLAPRINAAGRLGHPAAALDLLLASDPKEARDLAEQLERLNRERQAVEDRILRAAVAQVAEWPEAKQRRRGYVIAGEDWHQGVIGIVASRLVERYHRPVVLIAGGDDEWKGSGRSLPAFDLHGALGACSDRLERFGGHRAAAGLSILPENVEDFAEAFAREAEQELGDVDLRPVTTVDAVIPRGTVLGLDLCVELERLAPFGLGNPDVTLLAPGCALSGQSTVGEGKHLRFRVARDGRDAGGAIAFGLGAQLDRFRRPGLYDVAFRLKENRWNGMVAPQLVVRRIFDADPRMAELHGWLAELWRGGEEVWTPEARTIFAELELAAGARRHLLESATFRALLTPPALARAA
jgi:single-stranded-DNA-specific exonuclease